ncbi:hypothetical protein BGX28_004229 [Mortierella sp. GBA30]|nr:hypothetical protein BGX28_004229 [Mortierella sp. GBA30]
MVEIPDKNLISKALCPLELPETVTHIGTFLSGTDLVNAILVNRTWHSALEPVLWISVRLPTPWIFQSMPSRCQTSASVRRHCHWIRYISVADSPLLPDLIPGCNKLLELKLSVLTPETILLISQNASTLRILSRLASVHQPQRDIAQDWGFISAIATLTKLEELQLDRLAISLDESVAFFKTCGRLHDLRLYSCFWTATPPPMPGSEVIFVSNVDVAFPYLQQLTLIKNKISAMEELEFIAHCSNVRFLRWQTTFLLIPDQYQDIHELLLKRLRHLHTLDITSSSLADKDIAVIIKSLPALVNLRASSTRIGVHSVETIVQHRFNIQELEVRHCGNLEDHQMQTVLCSCPDLATFVGDQLSIQRVAECSWMCKRLQKLQISIINQRPLNNESDEAEDHARMFSQLAALTELTTLDLGSGGVCPPEERVKLTLEMGFGKLTTLTKLECLTIYDGLDEVEKMWVAEHWPKVDVTGI